MWKKYNDKYSVYSEGKVMNMITHKLLYMDTNHKGYYRVRLNGKRTFVHRLVAIVFVPNPLNLPQVNHKDHNKLNNFADNLEWCTNQYNNEHSFLHGRISGRTKLSVDALNDILHTKERVKSLAIKYNVKPITIYKVRSGANIKRLSLL